MSPPFQNTDKRGTPAKHTLQQPQKQHSAMKKTESKAAYTTGQFKRLGLVSVSAPGRVHITFDDDEDDDNLEEKGQTQTHNKGQKRAVESKDGGKVAKKSKQEVKKVEKKIEKTRDEKKMTALHFDTDDESSDFDPTEEAFLRARLAAVEEKKRKKIIQDTNESSVQPKTLKDLKAKQTENLQAKGKDGNKQQEMKEVTEQKTKTKSKSSKKKKTKAKQQAQQEAQK